MPVPVSARWEAFKTPPTAGDKTEDLAIGPSNEPEPSPGNSRRHRVEDRRRFSRERNDNLGSKETRPGPEAAQGPTIRKDRNGLGNDHTRGRLGRETRLFD